MKVGSFVAICSVETQLYMSNVDLQTTKTSVIRVELHISFFYLRFRVFLKLCEDGEITSSMKAAGIFTIMKLELVHSGKFLMCSKPECKHSGTKRGYSGSKLCTSCRGTVDEESLYIYLV